MLSTSGYDFALFAASVVDSAGLADGSGTDLIGVPWLLVSLSGRTLSCPCSGAEAETLEVFPSIAEHTSWSGVTLSLDFRFPVQYLS